MKKIMLVTNKTNGTVRGIYSDEALPLLTAMGEIRACRATDVELLKIDQGDLFWRAQLRDRDKTIIGFSDTRKEVIREEVAYLEKAIIPNAQKFDEILNNG